jgi:heavy metal sensor kinase
LQRDPSGQVVLKAEEHGGESPLGFVLVVQSTDGRVLLTFPKDPAPRWAAALSASSRGVRTITDGDESLRVLSDEESVGGELVVLHMARSESELRGQIREIILVLALLLPIALAAAAAGGLFLARKALLPIARMGDQARRISADRLGERMPIENPKDEIGQLGQAFNDTLSRLERAFAQLRKFTADASHELRTPLTALRSVGEVGLRNERDVAGHREVIGSMLEEVDRLTRLVDTLLLLARSDGGALPLARSVLSLPELAHEAVNTLAVLAEEKHLKVEIVPGEQVHVAGDRTLLRQVLVNLVHNAIRHSPASGTITVTITATEGFAQCCVRDNGPGIPAEHRARVFERFYRVDDARTQAAGGAGLGLALVRSIVELHGGTVALVEHDEHDGAGAMFCVRLPQHEANA